MAKRRLVVQVVAQLRSVGKSPGESENLAIRTVLEWLKHKQKLNLPNHAFDGEAFEIDAADGQPVSVERFKNLWSLQFDRFDDFVPGRVWRTEVSISHSDQTAFFGLRLAVIDSKEYGAPFVPSVPRIIRDLIVTPGLQEYGVEISDKPISVINDSDLDGLVELLNNRERRRPIVVFSEGSGSNYLEDAKGAAKNLAGLAHVYAVSEDQCWRLPDLIGKEFSVWNGAIRTYSAGFDAQSDETNQHPIATREWIGSRFGSMDAFVSMLSASFSAKTVRGQKIEDELPSFRTIRQMAIQMRINGLENSARGKSEREQLLEQEVALLTQQVEEKTAEYDMADEEVKKAETERDQYRAQVFALRDAVASLEEQVGSAVAPVSYPDEFDQIDQWALQHLSGRLILLNRASRAARKSTFRDPELVYRCLERLARGYVDSRRAGNPTDRIFDDLGVHLERTGDESWLKQWKSEYFVSHRGKSQFLEWHVKKGSDKNDENTMRIYFFYDEDDQQVVVGHLPGHLTNSKS